MNYLSKNIRYLRKSRKWSQEVLADNLGVKRSNIEAYESKNVRPRLDFIVDLSRLFKVRMSDLIEVDLESSGELGQAQSIDKQVSSSVNLRERALIDLDIHNPKSVNDFIEHSLKIRKMLEGFRTFYRFKLENFDHLNGDARRLASDIENFLLLMEHLLSHNDAVIKAVSGQKDAITE